MAGLNEQECLDRLRQAFGEAVRDCRGMARDPQRGFHYISFMTSMRLLEGACRQVAHCREDTRWMEFANRMMPTVAKAGEWLRAYPVTTDSNPASMLFNMLADVLEAKLKEADRIQHMATGRTGMILPAYMR